MPVLVLPDDKAFTEVGAILMHILDMYDSVSFNIQPDARCSSPRGDFASNIVPACSCANWY